MIKIHDYKAKWPSEFSAIQSDLKHVLGDLALRVDHIGSTSVPGLGAKDIIDVQITVADFVTEVESRMEAAGFQRRPHIRDHVPMGEDPAPERWEKRMFKERPDERPANLHVRKLGNPNQRYAILFRDYLRAHPDAVQTVELIKREIAKRHAADAESYYDIKDPVYDLIWVAAQEWAQFTGWQI